MPAVDMPVWIAAPVALLAAAPGLAQTVLNASSPTVNLNSGEARSIAVSASKGGGVAYTVTGGPAWLTTSSGNNFTTPDTLYFRIANSMCGTCEATVTLAPAGGGEGTRVTVTYHTDTAQAQTLLSISPTSVNLSNTLARSITIKDSRGGVVAYTVAGRPPWLTTYSANNFTTPDTLSFQIANSNCGTCTAEILLIPTGGTETPVTVTYNLSAGSTYRVKPGRVTLAYPASPGSGCGAGYMSGCSIAMESSNAAVTTYNAKVNSTEGGSWLLINGTASYVNGAPVAKGLSLMVNGNAAGSMPAGVYGGQVLVYNPRNQSDILMVNVSLLVNPGSMTISPASGAGGSQTFTMQFPHPGGWRNLSVVNVLINNTLDVKHACYLAYLAPPGTLLLTDDEGNDPGPAGTIAPGNSGTIENGQCGVRLVSSAGEGNLLTLTLNVTFRASFAGSKTIYLASRDNAENNSGWQALGTWEVKVAPPPKTAPKKKGRPGGTVVKKQGQ